MDTATVVALLRHDNQLKETARTGWVQRGVRNAENVAAHSHGVTFATLLLSQLIQQPVDLGKALTMAVLHDLPEGLTTDIPTTAWKYLPTGSKLTAERKAMETILGSSAITTSFMEVWEEMTVDESAEAKLVHDADKIDMYLQAVVYQEQTGNRHLEEFWRKQHTFHFPEAQAIYDELRQRFQELTQQGLQRHLSP